MTPTPGPDISIIIPVLNESGNLHHCLASISDDPLVEVILSDGGSTDDSLEIAHRFRATVVHSQRGRASQMNAGARNASGDVLLFLHADTRLPSDAAKSIRTAVENGFEMGCFERAFDSDHILLRHTSRWAGWRAKHFFLVYGDQAIFIQRHLFEGLNGYRELDRFEDVDLALRAKKHGCWTVLPGPIITGARRFNKSPIRRIILDACLTLAWLLGIIRE